MSEITGDGAPRGINSDEIRQDLECSVKNPFSGNVCGAKTFHVIVIPRMVVPGAVIVMLQCVKCRSTFVVDEKGVVGNRERLYKDHHGRNHHTLKAETGVFNFSGKNNP